MEKRHLPRLTNDFQADIKNATDVLRKGGIILYPTDTVWGIGCDATNEDAVRKIFQIKQREDSKSMLSLVDSLAMLERTVSDIPEVAYDLIEAAVHPITIVYDNPTGLAKSLLAPDGSAGIRITSESFSNELRRRLGKPVVSTSANLSGMASSTDFASIDGRIIDSVDYAVHYGRDMGKDAHPSSVIKLSAGGLFKVLR